MIFEDKIEELLSQLTLEEKVSMLHGQTPFETACIERLGIPELRMSDGPMGVRAEFRKPECCNEQHNDEFVTYLPSNSAICSTWSEALAKRAGQVLGQEARGRRKDIILAPGINIKRSPLCGRNFEYMSEDPTLIEKIAVPLIEGIQENDVSACVKHFACNSQETNRLWVDTLLDKRALHEIYLRGFKAATLKAKTKSIMGAYNLLYGEHCCQSQFLLGDILRKSWGYDGMVVSDWGGVHDTKTVANSDLDIEMNVTFDPNNFYMAELLVNAVKGGEILESKIDDKVRNILRLMFRLKMIGDEKSARQKGEYNTEKHRQTTLEIARESIILLKNEDNILPLDETKLKKIAVIGENANRIHSLGGGSAEIKALYEICPLMGITKYLGGNCEVKYAQGYYTPVRFKPDRKDWLESSIEYKVLMGEAKNSKIEKDIKEQTHKLQREAVALAKECDTVIYIGGTNHDQDTEGLDKPNIKMPYKQDELINELLKVNKNIIFVINGGSAIEMPWQMNAKAILWTYYNGMEGGTALAEVIFGKTNPCGKLAETLPLKLEDMPSHKMGEFGKKDSVHYNESIMVGYRYFDSENLPVMFEFGHGLSYTNFEYSNFKVTLLEKNDLICRVSLKVKNIGNCFGKDIVQIYLQTTENSVVMPKHQLAGFTKVSLEVGEEKDIEIILDKQNFAYYDEKTNCFKIEKGKYIVELAKSSKDIVENEQIQVENNYSFN